MNVHLQVIVNGAQAAAIAAKASAAQAINININIGQPQIRQICRGCGLYVDQLTPNGSCGHCNLIARQQENQQRIRMLDAAENERLSLLALETQSALREEPVIKEMHDWIQEGF